MDNKNQLEELGQDIYDNCPELCEDGCGGKPCYKCIAEALQRDGYCKIPENAVVLTHEEWAEHCEQFAKAMYQKEVNIRKETTEMFAYKAKQAFGNISVMNAVIDEICKEFNNEE